MAAEVIFTGPAQQPNPLGNLGQALPAIAQTIKQSQQEKEVLKEFQRVFRANSLAGLGQIADPGKGVDLNAAPTIQQRLQSLLQSAGGARGFINNPAAFAKAFELLGEQQPDVTGAVQSALLGSNPKGLQPASEVLSSPQSSPRKSFTTPRDTLEGGLEQELGETKKVIKGGAKDLDDESLAKVDVELPDDTDSLGSLDNIRQNIIRIGLGLDQRNRNAFFSDPIIKRVLTLADRVDETESEVLQEKFKAKAKKELEIFKQQQKFEFETRQQEGRLQLEQRKAELKQPPAQFETIENSEANRKKFKIPPGFGNALIQRNTANNQITLKTPSGETIEVGPDGGIVITRGDISAKVKAQQEQAVLGATDALSKTSNIIKQIKEGGQGILGVAGNIGDLLNIFAQFTGNLPAPKRDEFIRSLRGTRTSTLRTLSDERGRFTEPDFQRVKELYADEGIWESVPGALNAMFEIQSILVNRLVVNDADPSFLDAKALGVTPGHIAEMVKRNYLNNQQAFRVFKLLFPGELERRLSEK